MTDTTDITSVTLEQTRAAAQELLDNTTGDLTGADAQRFEALSAHATGLREREQQRDAVRRDLVQNLASGKFRSEGESHSLPGYGRADTDNEDRNPAMAQRDTAMRTLESAVTDERLDAAGAELVERLMNTGPAPAQTWTQRYAAAAGSEHYERAFAKLLANPTHGHLSWTPAEAEAYRAVDAVRIEQRAMGLSDSAGGYMVPLTLDPAIMLSSNGSINRCVRSAAWCKPPATPGKASPVLVSPPSGPPRPPKWPTPAPPWPGPRSRCSRVMRSCRSASKSKATRSGFSPSSESC